MTAPFQPDKFKAVVHHLCAGGGPDLGRVALHKALYLADMMHYLDRGEPLTGEDHVKQAFGPTARHLNWALDELVRDGCLRVSRESFFGLPRHVFEAFEQPASNHLSDHDRALLDQVLRFVSGGDVGAMAELLLDEAWKVVPVGDVIPYETAFWLVPVEITESDVAWAEQAMRAIELETVGS